MRRSRDIRDFCRALTREQIIAMPVEAICVRLLSRSIPGAAAAGITSLSILSGVVLLSDEYRLTVNGLVFGLLAILLLAAAKACFDFDNLRNDTYDIRSGPNVTFQAIIWTSFALTACWTLTLEGIWPAILDLRRANIFMLILNVFSSAAMIVTGGCAFYRMPVHSASRGKTVSVRVHILFTTASMACVVGLCSALSLVMIGRSYTTFIQLLAFVSLVATAGLTAMYTSTEMQRPVVDPVPHEMLLHDEQESHDSGSPSAAPGPRKSAERFRDQIGGSQLGPLSTGIVAAAVACLGWWLLSNFGAISYPTIPPNPPPHLDLDYKPTVDLDVVVSLYKEPLSHITTLVNVLKESASFPAQSYRLIIYSKDEDADVDLIKKTTGALNVTKLPNVGREGETYLRHMTQQWDNLAKHTAFLQADVHNIREFRPRFRDYFDPESTGMLSLGFSGVTCDCNDCGDRWGWHDDTKLVPTLYPDVYGGSAECSRALLSYKGQFIASARRIRGVKREVYEELWKAFVDPDSWAHQPEYVKGNTDKMSAPYFGYAVERLWSILMQCSDLDLAWKCPTLLSQTRRGGSKADCQCFDVAQS